MNYFIPFTTLYMSESTYSLTEKDLRAKIQECVEIVKDANKKREGFEMVLNTFFSSKPLSQKTEYRPALYTLQEQLEFVKSVLRDYGKAMRNPEIHAELVRRGINMKRTTLDAYLSDWKNGDDAPLIRVGKGLYALPQN